MTTNGSVSADVIETDPILPLTIYGPEPSYFTGKLEAVVRFMELPYQRIAKSPMAVANATGVAQVPGLLLADDRWLTDSTPIIAWLDERFPDFELIPRDPVIAFFSRLLEDHADEWLWRPATHYRWDYPLSAEHMSYVLIDEAARDVKLPKFIKRYFVANRQRALFTKGDGVSPATWNHVEKIFLDTLKHLEAILKTRPYLLGTRPSLVDFGFFGPGFRHFAQDPTSVHAGDRAGRLRVDRPRVEFASQRDRRRAPGSRSGRLGTDPRFDRLSLPSLPLRQRRSVEKATKPLRRQYRGRSLQANPHRALSRLVFGRTAPPLRSPIRPRRMSAPGSRRMDAGSRSGVPRIWRQVSILGARHHSGAATR